MANRVPLALLIRPLPPFRLDLTAWALRRRSRNVIDQWDGSEYRRVMRISSGPTEVVVRQTGSSHEPRLIVHATPPPQSVADRRRIRATLDRLLGLRVDVSDWYRLARRDTRLRSLAERFRGLKPPRFPSVFEALINAFACQQLSLEVGLELLNRLAIQCDVKATSGPHAQYAFPDAHEVARQTTSRLRPLGFSRQKARAAIDLARAIVDGRLDLEMLDRESDEAIRQRLFALRGVGRWTAEYVLLRGLGRLHVFPGDDVGAQKRLARWLGRSHPLDYAGVRRVVERWQPFAGMVYFHLLLDGLAQRGFVLTEATPTGRSRP